MNIRYGITAHQFKELEDGSEVLVASTHRRKAGRVSGKAANGVLDLRYCNELLVNFRLKKQTLQVIMGVLGLSFEEGMTSNDLAKWIFSERCRLYLLFNDEAFSRYDVIRTYKDVDREHFVCVRDSSVLIDAVGLNLPGAWNKNKQIEKQKDISIMNDLALRKARELVLLKRTNSKDKKLTVEQVFKILGGECMYENLSKKSHFLEAYTQSRLAI